MCYIDTNTKIFSNMSLTSTSIGKVGLSTNEENTVANLNSRIGYYIEKYVAVTLYETFINFGYMPIYQNRLKELRTEKEIYKKEKILKVFKNLHDEVKIAEIQGKELADRIFSENNPNDLSYNFDIITIGEKMKFTLNGDISIEFNKNHKSNITYISIKGYKSLVINLNNSTLISFIKKLMFSNIKERGLKFIEKIVLEEKWKNEFKEIINISKDFDFFKNQWKKEGIDDYRKKATNLMNMDFKNNKSRYQLIRDFIIKFFNEFYNSNKKEINKNFISILNFENESIYIAITNNQLTKIISTKTNKKFKNLVRDFKKPFTVKMETNSEKNSFFIIFKDGTNRLFLKLSVSLKEAGKPNIWLNLKNIGE